MLARNPDAPKVKIVWTPIPNSAQDMMVQAPFDHALFHGARGGGKTECQLFRFHNLVGKGYGQFLRGVIFDREYKNLDDLISKSERYFHQYDNGAKYNIADTSWSWASGEVLMFRHIKRISDYQSYHGQEFPFIGWNELCKQPTPQLYDMMMSCNRSSFTPEKDTPLKSVTGEREDGSIIIHCDRSIGKLLPPIPEQVISTTNSYGPGHTWVKQRFIDPIEPGKMLRITTRVFNPATQTEVDITKTQIAIFSSWRNNPYLSTKYIAALQNERDPNRRKSWYSGSWDIVAGGALSDLWDKHIHIVPRFQVPANWRIDRAFDWGSSHPFSVGWFAEANGEEIKYYDPVTCETRTLRFAAGTLIQIAEWYGAEGGYGANTGLKMSAVKIAEGIVEREKELMRQGWIKTQPSRGPADNQIRDVRESDVATIESKMADAGIKWLESDKSNGSRRNGLQLLRDRLEATKTGEGPGFVVMENCVVSIACFPSLPRDEIKLDDVDTESEDHAYDMVRYRILHAPVKIATGEHFKVIMPY